MGLESLHEIGEAWPPSAIEFAKMCRGTKEIGTACHKPFAFAALESDEMKQKKKEAAAVGLANLKNLMGVAND